MMAAIAMKCFIRGLSRAWHEESRNRENGHISRMDAPDLTKSPPRRGREEIGGWVWLARLADIARAQIAGTAGSYIAYDKISQEWLERMSLAKNTFNAVVEMGADDDFLVMFLNRRVDNARREKANKFILEEHRADLDRQDREEGYA
jgi:hypothetical protein